MTPDQARAALELLKPEIARAQTVLGVANALIAIVNNAISPEMQQPEIPPDA